MKQQLCAHCRCFAATSRDTKPVCYWHADKGLDDVACPRCDGPAYVDVAGVEDDTTDPEPVEASK